MLSGTATATSGAKTDKGNAAQSGKAGGGASAAPNPGFPADGSFNKEEFEKKALDKVKDFTNSLITVTQVNTNNDAAKKAINFACLLFVNEQAMVEVSNVNSSVSNKYMVRTYLNRLMLRSGQFDKVKLGYYNINYVSKFVKGTDGNYHGAVSFIQTFSGEKDGQTTYKDATKRTIDVVIKPYQKEVNGESVLGWNIYLGDIGVVETKKI